ncbi:MAG TPA: hypothetical protein VKV32_18455 [Stellaceae bacterium]|nr:hypothetical protein [Stellaceae bacterium]
MPQRKSATSLSPEEMQLLEKLVEKNVLVAVPPKRMGKPRPVISASLAPGGKQVLLYLSQEPVALE